MITHAPMYIPGDPGRLDLAGFDPEKVLPGVVLGEHFSSQGIEAHSFQYYNIIRSGLSRMFLKNTTIHPYGSDTELWINLRKLVESKAEQKLFVGIYWGRVDSLSHLYGPDDERPAAEFAHFMAEFSSVFINKLDPKKRKDTLFLLIADHGQITTPKQPHYDLKNHPDLLRRLHIRPTGENRAAYFYIKPGQFEAVREYLDRKFLGQFIQIDPVYAAQHGLFGPGGHHSRLLERTGDLMTIAKDAAYLWWSDKENPLLGRHGGLHEEEMIVPFFAAAL